MLTMLEACHRFDLSPADCRAYAVEILWAAQLRSRPEPDLSPNPKESPLCRCLRSLRPAAMYPP
jgi:hypothetical protein